METKTKDLSYYMSLTYTIEVLRDSNPDNPGWVAVVKELPGCITQGDTWEELGEMVDEAMRLWIETALEDGMAIPEPQEETCSGKFIVRMAKSLHRQLTEAADKDGVSLNYYVTYATSKMLGETKGRHFESELSKYLDECLGQIEAIIENGDIDGAYPYITQIKSELRKFDGLNDIIPTYIHAIDILEKSLAVSDDAKKNLIHQVRQNRLSLETKSISVQINQEIEEQKERSKPQSPDINELMSEIFDKASHVRIT